MTIEHAILGLLSWKPLSGYDLKKMFEDSSTLYWSGNNNEIYRALVSLHRNEMVSFEVQPQEHRPARKIYTVTPKGQAKLHEWLQSAPEPPQRKQIFLIQLAWADRLEAYELDRLLAQYADEVQMELLLSRAQEADAAQKPGSETRARFLNSAQARTPREALLWTSIQHNWSTFYKNELAWVTRLRAELAAMENKKNEP